MNYDVIGDIHGCVRTLEALLTKLGYENSQGIWRHPERKVIFLGDFIDRGPFQEEVISTVRPMIESGAALSVMGNHEFNAISFFTESTTGDYLRKHSEKNINQHKEFLKIYEKDSDKWKNIIDWFKTLPLWLDLDEIRIVHACWDSQYIKEIEELQNGAIYLSDDLLHAANDKESPWQYQAIETLLKGKEIDLPDGITFKDKDGTPRHSIRVRWWDASATTYRSAFLGPETARTHIPDDPIPGDHLTEYPHDTKPVFLGHYWLEGPPMPLADNIACVDYSVAHNKGKLIAYRWDGEGILCPEKFISVDKLENN